jgi:hypothetical protein
MRGYEGERRSVRSVCGEKGGLVMVCVVVGRRTPAEKTRRH